MGQFKDITGGRYSLTILEIVGRAMTVLVATVLVGQKFKNRFNIKPSYETI